MHVLELQGCLLIVSCMLGLKINAFYLNFKHNYSNDGHELYEIIIRVYVCYEFVVHHVCKKHFQMS